MRFPALLMLISTAFAAEPSDMPEELVEPDRQLPGISLMPIGSVLTKVLIPRYDSGRQLTASLRAAELKVQDSKTIEGKNVELRLYNPDRSIKAQVDLAFARFDQSKGVLTSQEPVQILSKDFHARGAGIVYTYQQKQSSQGFLTGPVTTRFFAKPKAQP